MLSLDKDGNVEDHCDDDDINGDCGHTHYQFKAVDENGNIVASELVETGGRLTEFHDFHTDGTFNTNSKDYFQVAFTAESGNLTLFVSLGRLVGGKYKAMSDTASVTLEVPDDLRALDQTYDEYRRVLNDITGQYDENEDAERWLGKNTSGANRSIWNPDPAQAFSAMRDTFDPADNTQKIMTAHLNNQLK